MAQFHEIFYKKKKPFSFEYTLDDGDVYVFEFNLFQAVEGQKIFNELIKMLQKPIANAKNANVIKDVMKDEESGILELANLFASAVESLDSKSGNGIDLMLRILQEVTVEKQGTGQKFFISKRNAGGFDSSNFNIIFTGNLVMLWTVLYHVIYQNFVNDIKNLPFLAQLREDQK